MIANSLSFVTRQLDDFLKRKTSTKTSIVKLSGVNSSQGSGSVTQENALALTLVNIVEELSIVSSAAIKRDGDALVKQVPPLYINVYFLVSAGSSEGHYEDGLRWLSLAMNFFQQHPYFHADQISMPEGIDKLSFELVNLDIDNMSRFWGALGAPYQPSVIYKMRMLKIDDDGVQTPLPEIKNSKTNA